jgi:translocation and assembly module TamB
MPRRKPADAPETKEPNVENAIKQASRRKRERSPKRGGSWPKRLGIVFILFLVVLFFLPNLIGWTPLKQMAIDYGLKDLQGRVTVDSLSLGWLQPVQMGGVKLVDANGQPMAQIESIKSSNRLFQFLTSRDYGTIDIVHPQISLVTREGGSNFEDAIRKYIEQPQPEKPESPLPPLVVNVSDARISVASQADASPWLLDKLNAKLVVGQQAAIVAEVTTNVARAEQFGSLMAQLLLDDKKKSIVADNGILQIQFDQASLGCLSPLLERVLGPVQLEGNLAGQLSTQFARGGNAFDVSFKNANVTNLLVSCPKYLGTDVVRLAKVNANGDILNDATGITARKLDIESEVGNLSTDGHLDWQQFQKLTEHGQLIESTFQLNGRIDLARVVQLLPKTLKLYDDLQIESGNVTCQVNSRPENGAGRLVVNVDTANLVAVRAGQRLAWQQPLRLVSTITQRRGQWELDEVKCESDFVNLTGNATARNGKFQANGDLSILMQRLGQFIDVRGWGIQGKLDGNFGWQVAAAEVATPNLSLLNQPLQFGGKFNIQEPLFALPGMKPWRESSVVVELRGNGTALPNGSAAIQNGIADITIGNEKLTAELSEPIADLLKQSSWKANCRMSGGVAKWLAHAGTFVDLSFLNTDGQAAVTTTALMDADQILLSDLKYQIHEWKFDGYGMTIREPEVTGDGTLRYDLKTGQMLVPEITLVCSSVAARGDQITLDVAKHLDVRGDVAFRADTHRVLDWFGMFPSADSVHFFGGVDGMMKITSSPQAIGCQLSGKIADFIAAQQVAGGKGEWNELLREPVVTFQTNAAITQDFSRLDFAGLEANAASLKLKADGSLADLSGTMLADVSGQWSPDWQQIQKLLDAYTYKMVQLAGRQDQSFAVKGPLLSADPRAAWPPRDLQIVSQVGWQQGVVALLPVGAAEVTASVANGVAKLDTGVIPFSQGQVQFAPTLNLYEPQQVINLPAGPIATNISLTPDICRDWMKFVAPMIADVAAAQGKVSVETSGLVVPLADFNAANGQGIVTLNEVTVGAGPMGMKILEAVESIRMMLKPMSEGEPKDRSVWMKLDQQQVPFAIANGRVFHENMRITMKDLTLKTSGSVGLDQSLQMVAEIPIADDWIKGEAWMASLKGETIKIPITGSVTNPKLDMQAIKQLSMSLVQRTAAAKLNGVVGEQTERLQSKVGGEINKLKDNLGGQLNKAQKDVNEKVQGEVLKGLDSLFGPKRDK